MRNSKVFITGATGFVGAGLAAYYLSKGSAVFVLCRGNNLFDMEYRMENALTSIDSKKRWKNGTLHIVPGDVTFNDMGIGKNWHDSLYGKIDLFIHAAGFIRFETEDARNMEINYFGARNAAQIAKDLKANKFIHISTAYVCGKSTGWIEEKIAQSNNPMHNGYEYSKILGEHAVMDTFGCNATIVRPSIVVGPLGTNWENCTPVTFAGYYGYFKGFYWLKKKLKSNEEKVDLGNTRIPGDPEAEINLIPLDNFTSMVDALAETDESNGGIFHTTHPNGPRYEPLVRQSLTFMGITGGKFVLPDAMTLQNLTPVEELIKDAVHPFIGYVGEQRRFITSNMNRFYDMNEIPSIGSEECKKLLTSALKCKFKSADKRLEKV